MLSRPASGIACIAVTIGAPENQIRISSWIIVLPCSSSRRTLFSGIHRR